MPQMGKAMSVRVGVPATGAFSVSLSVFLCAASLLLGIGASYAQAPPRPVTGFVPTFEIMRKVRAVGFNPLAPPLREGTTYVLRATDFRGILMRVVVDARTGAIRDVARIVPANSGQIGMTAPPYYDLPPRYAPYGPPIDYYGPSGMRRPEEGGTPRLPQPPAASTGPHPGAVMPPSPPLPRPRPAALASKKPINGADPANPVPSSGGATGAGDGVNAVTNAAAASTTKPDLKSDASSAAPVAPAVPSKPGPAGPIND
jgi:hypothetical protein